MKRKSLLVMAILAVSATAAQGQGIMGGHVTGQVQLDGQMSRADSTIGAQDVPERLLMNARADIMYTNGDFSAGLRFEMYQNPLLGFDAEYKGQGIANYFVSYNGKRLSVTAGNFYEQFGNGLILRTYEDRNLGLDNSLFGLGVQFRPVEGVTLKAVAGKQRVYWGYGEGLVRGVDAEVNLGSLVKAIGESKFRATLGAGFVSKYEEDESIPSAANAEMRLNLPLNVGAASVRADVGWGNWSLQAEYVRKGQDPSAIQRVPFGDKIYGYIYRPGEAMLLGLSYSQRGFSASLQAKRIDNMGFKSVRSRSGEMLYINYLPAITKNHTYAFLAMYPYATQVNGEQGLQGDVMYKFKKGTLLGGKYGGLRDEWRPWADAVRRCVGGGGEEAEQEREDHGDLCLPGVQPGGGERAGGAAPQQYRGGRCVVEGEQEAFAAIRGGMAWERQSLRCRRPGARGPSCGRLGDGAGGVEYRFALVCVGERPIRISRRYGQLSERCRWVHERSDTPAGGLREAEGGYAVHRRGVPTGAGEQRADVQPDDEFLSV